MIKVRYLPLEKRLELYEKAMELKQQGKNCVEIARILNISPSTVRSWFKGHKPMDWGKYKHNLKVRHTPREPNLQPTPELSYLLGAYWSDGWLGEPDKRYEIGLAAKDREFVVEFERCLRFVLGRDRPYKIREKKGLYIVEGYSLKLQEFLLNPIKHVDIVKAYPREFLRGLFDGDGGVYAGNKKGTSYPLVFFTTTDPVVLELAKIALDILGIEYKVYLSNKRCKRLVYDLRIQKKDSILKFYREVGFTIKRKQETLEEAVRFWRVDES